MNKNNTTVILVESALMIALSVVLDFFKLWQMPFGGTVTCGMVPLVLLSFHQGPKWGIGAAFPTACCRCSCGLTRRPPRHSVHLPW